MRAMWAMQCALVSSSYAFQVQRGLLAGTPATVINTAELQATSRSRSIAALLDPAALDASIFTMSTSSMIASSSVLPPEFQNLMDTHETHPPFSHYLMNAVGTYIIISGACQFVPRILAKITGVEPTTSEAAIAKYLNAAPISSFGWHNADLRVPLPASVQELHEHPIGVRDGKRVYLCSAQAAINHHIVELSQDFTEHYGEKVYICYA